MSQLTETASNMPTESIQRSIAALREIANRDGNTTFICLMALEAIIVLKEELKSREKSTKTQQS